MMLIGSDFIDNNASFNTSLKRNGPNVFIYAYAGSGTTENTPAFIQFMGSGYNATAIVASNYGYVGIPEGTVSVGAGSWGWYQIRGKVSDVQAASDCFTGSVGHAVNILGTTVGLGATSSAYVGNPVIGQVGVLLEEVSASTTADIYLCGVWATPIG